MKTTSLQTHLGSRFVRNKITVRLSARLLALIGGGIAATAASAADFESAIILASRNPQTDGWYGFQVGPVPDVSGDGVNDFFVINEPYAFGASSDSPGALQVYNGVTRDLLWTYESPLPASRNSLHATGIGDVNGDGFGDLIISGTTLHPDQPWVELVDGANGDLIHQLPSLSGVQARSLSPVPDVTGDGVPDVVIGSRNPSQVLLHDGATGKRLRSLAPPNGPDQTNIFGYALAGVPDVTGDSLGEVLIGNWRMGVQTESGTLSEAGSAYLYDGASGKWLHTFTAPTPVRAGQFGRSLAVLGDVNGDGVGEFVFGADGMDSVFIFDGATQTYLRTLTLKDPYSAEFFGWTVKRLPDVNGDGIDEVIVGGFPQPWGTIGEVFVLDPVTGETLAAFPDYSFDEHAVVGLEDLNGDGLGELLISNYFGQWEGHPGAGFVSLYLSDVPGSLPKLEICSDAVLLSYPAGSEAQLESRADLFASWAPETQPGMVVDGVHHIRFSKEEAGAKKFRLSGENAPELMINRKALLLSYRSGFADWQLESHPTLGAPVSDSSSWQPVETTRVGGQRRAILSASNLAEFYRLRRR